MENSHRCLCGKSYNQQSALSNHQRTCKSAKVRLSSTLGKAKEFLQSAKKRRIEAADTSLLHNDLSESSASAPNVPVNSMKVIVHQQLM